MVVMSNDVSVDDLSKVSIWGQHWWQTSKLIPNQAYRKVWVVRFWGGKVCVRANLCMSGLDEMGDYTPKTYAAHATIKVCWTYMYYVRTNIIRECNTIGCLHLISSKLQYVYMFSRTPSVDYLTTHTGSKLVALAMFMMVCLIQLFI